MTTYVQMYMYQQIVVSVS